MSGNIAIAVVLQFMLVCLPLNGQAAALNHHDRNPDQSLSTGRELSRYCFKHRVPLRAKDSRQVQLLERCRILAKLQQSDLLQDLLLPREISHESEKIPEELRKIQEISHESEEQETGLLEGLLVEKSIP